MNILIVYCVLRIIFMGHHCQPHNFIMYCDLHMTGVCLECQKAICKSYNISVYKLKCIWLKMHRLSIISFSLQWFSSVVSHQHHLKNFYKVSVLKFHCYVGMGWVLLSCIFASILNIHSILRNTVHSCKINYTVDSFTFYLSQHIPLYICIYVYVKMNLCSFFPNMCYFSCVCYLSEWRHSAQTEAQSTSMTLGFTSLSLTCEYSSSP